MLSSAGCHFGFVFLCAFAGVFQGKAGYTYARQGTPTTDALERKITRMEGGVSSLSFATGMAALSALFTTLLRAGDHLISSQYIFGNTNSLFGTLQLLGVEITLVDPTDVKAVAAALRPNTRMVFTETIANPGTQVADLEGIGEFCKANQLVYVVDNTLTSPWLFQPRVVGASIVMNSLSKHIGGHAHALGGSLTDTGLFDWSTYPNILDVYKKGAPAGWGMTQIKKKGLRDMGATLSADAAHRIAVGAETLSLRLDKICSNAMALATAAQAPRRNTSSAAALPLRKASVNTAASGSTRNKKIKPSASPNRVYLTQAGSVVPALALRTARVLVAALMTVLPSGGAARPAMR